MSMQTIHERCAAWAEAGGMRPSEVRGGLCPQTLRLSYGLSRTHFLRACRYQACELCLAKPRRLFDHARLWLNPSGGRVLTLRPYARATVQELGELRALYPECSVVDIGSASESFIVIAHGGEPAWMLEVKS